MKGVLWIEPPNSMIWVRHSCRLFLAHAMKLDRVGFIVRNISKTQYPGHIRVVTVWFDYKPLRYSPEPRFTVVKLGEIRTITSSEKWFALHVKMLLRQKYHHTSWFTMRTLEYTHRISSEPRFSRSESTFCEKTMLSDGENHVSRSPKWPSERDFVLQYEMRCSESTHYTIYKVLTWLRHPQKHFHL